MAQQNHAPISDDEMIPIRKSEFTSGAPFPANVYLRIKLNNYVLVARAGDLANLEQLHVANDDSIEYLYVKKEEYKNCVGQNLVIAGILINNKEVSGEKKAHFISKAMDGVFTEIEELGMGHEAIEHAKVVATSVRTLVQSKPDLFSVVEMMSSIPGDVIRHSMAVGAISVMIGHKMKWTLSATMEKLVIGALLHDVGLRELPHEILEKPRHEMTLDERQLYETHPFRGGEILRSMPSITDDITAIVYEHHENAIGQGYPRRLRDIRMNPLAKVVALANTFVDISIKGPNNPNPRTPEQALTFIEVTMGQPYNKKAFIALRDLVNERKASAHAA